MKNLIPITLSLVLSSPAICLSHTEADRNNIIGFWQADEARIGSGFADHFCFYSNGTFEFIFTSFSETKGILRLRGSYTLKGAQLTLIIREQIERVGGVLKLGGYGADSVWTLHGGSVQTIHPHNLKPEIAEIRVIKANSNGNLAIEIDGHPYYKISSDPNFGKVK